MRGRGGGMAPALVALLVAIAAPAHAQSTIRGSVRESGTGAPIENAYLELVGTRFSARSAPDGGFSIGRVPAGGYALRVTRLGFVPRVDSLQVVADSVRAIDVELTRAPVPLSAIVVTPGFYGMMETGLVTAHTLSRQDIEAAPQLGEDVYRSAARLPGVTSNDMSAKFTVRGAPGEELYATLDGLELDEPFHLKDIDAALSILDVTSIAGVELSTGGFPAEFGNKLTGVFAMHTVEPATDRVHSTLALSILNARYTAQGGARDGRIGWFMSARRGYLDVALKLVSEDDSLSPRYYDVFGKLYWDLPRGGRVALHMLLAGDQLNYLDGNDHLNSRYGNRYLWLTWAGNQSSRLRQTTVASLGRITWDRAGDIFERDGTQIMFLDDDRGYDAAVLRQDWTFEPASRFVFKSGVEAKRLSASYDYHNWMVTSFAQADTLATRVDSVDVVTEPSGTLLGAYVSQRVRLTDALIAEGGVRFDRASWSDDADVSPRLNLSWEPFGRTTLRAAWGRYVQPQGIHTLQVSDGVSTFAPAERAEHRGLGLEQRLPGSRLLRVELYDRVLTHLRPRFVNQFNSLEVFSEVQSDRLKLDAASGRARGVELFLQRHGSGRVNWSLNYALAEVFDRIGTREVPRSMDQRHTVNADWSYQPTTNRWRFSVAALWHSGWPSTPAIFTVDTIRFGTQGTGDFVTQTFGPYASERLPAYRRLDVRYTRYWDTRRGRVALYTDVFNLLGSVNARGYEYSVRATRPALRVARGYDTLLPRLPSLGVSWEF